MPTVAVAPKFSWIPMAVGIVLPLAIIGALLLVTTRERQAEGIDITAPPTGGIQSAFVEVELINAAGKSVVGRPVTFVHRQAGEQATVGEQTYHATSDASGVATLSVPKMGMLSIQVEGMEKKTVLPAMEMHGSRQIRVRLTVDR